MGLLSKIFRKKEINKKLDVKKEEDATELTEEELDKVCGHTPYSDWCPKAKVEPIDIRRKQTIHPAIPKHNNLGR